MIPAESEALAAIRQRVSIRSYADREVEPPLLEGLLRRAAMADHLSTVGARVELVSGEDAVQRVLTFVVGSYGLVTNAPYLLAGVLPVESQLARIDLGYVLEQVVLEATRLGLGTCWVTGTYDHRKAGDAVGLVPGEVAAAVCALGHRSETLLGRIHTGTVRRLAGGRRRKPLSEIVFSERWGQAWTSGSADPTLKEVLEYARLAPSASNRQPWRFVLRIDDSVVLILVRPKPIDAGIVMAHYALASAALGRRGRWELRLGDEALAEECALPPSVLPVAVFA